MVRILANGDIVPDDDPRARQATNRSTTTSNTRTPHTQMHNQFQGQNHAPGQQVSIFHSLNERLLAFGIPRWNIGQTVIEPIVSVGFLLSLVLFGLPGIIFAGVLFAVSRWSQDGPPQFLSGFFGNNPSSSDRRGGDGSSRGQSGTGTGGRNSGGHRLGHS